MTSKLLHYVVTVAELRSFSGAARQLYVSQPALSQSIKSLEIDLGTPLFDRSTVPLKLTYAGEKFVNTAQQMLRLERELRMELAVIADRHREHLVVGGTLLRNTTILPRVFPLLHARHPELSVNFVEDTNTNLITSALNGKLDLTFLNNNIPGELYSHELFNEQILLAVGPDHPLARRHGTDEPYPPINLNELQDEHFVLLSAGFDLRARCNEIFAQYNFVPNISLETNSMRLAHHMAAQNSMVTILLESMLWVIPPEQRAVCFRFDRGEWTNKLQLCYRKDLTLTPPMESFIQITGDLCRQPQDMWWDPDLLIP